MAITKKKLPPATPEAFEGATLMRMRSQNIKAVRLVDVTFTDTVTMIGGDNEAGKTSYLDSLGICLGPKEAIPPDPIHHGEREGSITVDFGDGKEVKLSAHCTIQRVGDTDWTREVVLDIPGHIPPTAIQTFLGKLIGKDSFDPMEFDLLSDAEKFDKMQRFVTGFDFKKHAANYKTIYDKRRDINRDQGREQSAADAIVYAAEPPSTRIDEAALAEELRLAGEKNLLIERKRGNRQKAVDTIEAAKDVQARAASAIATATQNAEAARDRELERIEGQIAALQRQMFEVRNQCEETVERETVRIRGETAAVEAEVKDLQAKLDAAGALDEPVDTAAISERITQARESNKKLDDWESQKRRHAEHQKKADDYVKESTDLTDELAALDAAKEKAILEATMPVEGLGFGDGYITLPGTDGKPVPWIQASMAQRMDATCSIAMALNPKLKVILIRNASNLGKTIRERIRQRASERGYRVLMEVVEEGGGTQVVIEDGVVKAKAPESTAGAAA